MYKKYKSLKLMIHTTAFTTVNKTATIFILRGHTQISTLN